MQCNILYNIFLIKWWWKTTCSPVCALLQFIVRKLQERKGLACLRRVYPISTLQSQFAYESMWIQFTQSCVVMRISMKYAVILTFHLEYLWVLWRKLRFFTGNRCNLTRNVRRKVFFESSVELVALVQPDFRHFLNRHEDYHHFDHFLAIFDGFKDFPTIPIIFFPQTWRFRPFR